MNQSYSSALYKLVHKIETLRKQIQPLLACRTTTFLNKKHQLQKRYERCLNKLATLTSPVVKAGAAFGLTTILSTSAIAQKQPCSTFHNSVYSIPIKRVSLPYLGLGKPSFVDIDGDGDLDCFEEYYDNFGSTHRGYIIFLRNNGTKNIPYFEQDTASGFPSTLTLDLGTRPISIDGAVFADVDGDGDYDCLLGSYLHCCGETIIYFENTGTKNKPKFTERDGAANPFSNIYGYYGLSYALADLDSDGDYDLIATNYAYTRIYTNIGTAKVPKFQLTQSNRENFSGHITIYDWNKDGLIDYFNEESYNKNIGTPQNAVFQLSHDGPHLPPYFYLQQFVDINNDGFIDIFDEYGNFATTSPDAFIQTDSIHNTLQAYPKKDSFSYRWQRNGKQIPGATTPHFTPKIPGMYTVEITGSCGTSVSYPYAYKTTQKTLLDEAENSSSLPLLSLKTLLPLSDIKTYPNPFTHSFILQLDNKYPLYNISIRICDIEGRIVQTIRPNRYSLSMGEPLAKGLFVIQVWQNGAIVYQQKILKE